MFGEENMELSVLVDNNTFIDQYFLGEPAVSYYIEVKDKRILFDTGYSGAFIDNARKLNINLNKLTHIILSHGHNDHTNGLKFLSNNYDICLSMLKMNILELHIQKKKYQKY